MFLANTTTQLSAPHNRYTTNSKDSNAHVGKNPLRDPFADIKKAKSLKQALQKSQVDLGSGFGGSDTAWVTDMTANWAKVEAAKSDPKNAGNNPVADKQRAKELKKHLQRTTLQLGFDARYM